MARKIQRYGYKPDLGDPRDRYYAPKAELTLAASVDLRPKMPAVWDQGELGSCTAFALNALVSFAHPGFVGSKLWLYYKERVIEHSVKQDAGAEIRDGIKVLASLGIPPETMWPYDIAKFAKAPTTKVNKAAKLDLITEYQRLAGPADYKACLNEGFPFAVGITVFESFEGPTAINTGHIPMPGAREECLGGHAIAVVGYLADGTYICRNSWGADVMDKGYFYLPAAYLNNADLATDAWMIRKEF
jgi:C1A family cysteine protease